MDTVRCTPGPGVCQRRYAAFVAVNAIRYGARERLERSTFVNSTSPRKLRVATRYSYARASLADGDSNRLATETDTGLVRPCASGRGEVPSDAPTTGLDGVIEAHEKGRPEVAPFSPNHALRQKDTLSGPDAGRTSRDDPEPPHSAGPSREAPGPVPLPVVGNALDIVVLGLAELMLSYARRYGDIVKFSILSDQCYLLAEPEAVAYINTENSRNYLDRWTPPGFNDLLYEGNLRGLVFSQGKYWMQHRQIVGRSFKSTEFLKAFFDAVQEKTSYLMEECWEHKGEVGKVVNVHHAMRVLTLDIIGDAAFGTEFGAMKSGGHEIETRLSNVLNGVLNVIKSPLPLWRVVDTPGRAAIRRDLDRLHEIELELVNERRRRLSNESASDNDGVNHRDGTKRDLLGMLLKARDSGENRAFNFSDSDLMWDVHDIIFAGHETTASALGASLFQIAGSPRVLAKIHEELDRVLPDGAELCYSSIDKLEYLGMVLNETLRMTPPTALVGRIAKDDDVVNGYRIPAGSSVLMSPYVMGRLDRFWDNPDEFRPERFSKDAVAARHPMIHTPFGAGPRVCLGARMATLEAKAVLALILRRYTFERTQDELECEYNSTVSFKSGMDMVLRRRN